MPDHILIVDDNPQNLKLARVVLTSEGYDVETATDAEEALASVQRSKPALMVIDLQLPGMDGLDLTRRLKSDPRYRGIIVIALTAYAMKGDEEKAYRAGCDGYLSKPIDTKALPMAVAARLAARAPHTFLGPRI